MGLAHGPRDFELFFCNGVVADSLCTLVFVSSAGLGSREPSVRLFCSVNSVWLRWSQLWPVGSSVVSLEAQSLGSGPPCIPLGFFFFCYTTVSGLFLCLLSWAILTLLGKVKDKLAVPATVRARAVRCRRRLCPLQPRETSFG